MRSDCIQPWVILPMAVHRSISLRMAGANNADPHAVGSGWLVGLGGSARLLAVRRLSGAFKWCVGENSPKLSTALCFRAHRCIRCRRSVAGEASGVGRCGLRTNRRNAQLAIGYNGQSVFRSSRTPSTASPLSTRRGSVCKVLK